MLSEASLLINDIEYCESDAAAKSDSGNDAYDGDEGSERAVRIFELCGLLLNAVELGGKSADSRLERRIRFVNRGFKSGVLFGCRTFFLKTKL